MYIYRYTTYCFVIKGFIEKMYKLRLSRPWNKSHNYMVPTPDRNRNSPVWEYEPEHQTTPKRSPLPQLEETRTPTLHLAMTRRYMCEKLCASGSVVGPTPLGGTF